MTFLRHLKVGFVACVLAFAGLHAAAAPRSVQGMVSKVTDGDSLWLTPAGKPAIEVRLRDIDAPESCQPWGAQARDVLAELALDKVATLHISGRDAYGRTVGALMIQDLDVGRFLVENGHAWSIRTRWDQGPMVKQEKMARALGRGLHATPGAMQPKEFRRRHGPCQPGAAELRQDADVATVGALAVPTQTASRCDGRTLCSQMSSCEEARYFLLSCPGVKMDGDRDGVPCEKQWCGR